MALLSEPSSSSSFAFKVLAQVSHELFLSTMKQQHHDDQDNNGKDNGTTMRPESLARKALKKDSLHAFPSLDDAKDESPKSQPDCHNGSVPLLLVAPRATAATATPPITTSPMDYLEEVFAQHGIRLGGRKCHKGHLTTYKTEHRTKSLLEELHDYDMDITTAVRQGDLPRLQELYYHHGYSLDGCNRHGESLLHLACRRGHAPIVEFMLVEAKLNPRVMDDMGRTPFHDCLWSSHPNFETMNVLLKVLPPVGLLMQDVRGHSPFDYAPRKHWPLWVAYLQEREQLFVNWIVRRKQMAAAAAATRWNNHSSSNNNKTATNTTTVPTRSVTPPSPSTQAPSRHQVPNTMTTPRMARRAGTVKSG